MAFNPGRSGEIINDFPVSRAAHIMVVDNAAGLQMRIYGNGAKVFEPAFLQVGADSCRQTAAGRNSPIGMPSLEDGFAIAISP